MYRSDEARSRRRYSFSIVTGPSERNDSPRFNPASGRVAGFDSRDGGVGGYHHSGPIAPDTTTGLGPSANELYAVKTRSAAAD